MVRDVARWIGVWVVAIALAGLAGQAPATAQSANRPDGLVPTTPSAAYLMGRIASFHSDYDSAADFLVAALDNDPDRAALIDATFDVLVRAGRLDEALPLAQRILLRRPNNQLAQTVVLINRIDEGDLEGALAAMDTIEFDGIEVFVMPLVRAWLEASTADMETANQTLDGYAEDTGLDSIAAFHRALILDAAGDGEAALTAYQEAEDLSRSGRLVIALGSLYERLGRTEEAEQLYADYQADNPSTVLSEYELDRIARGETALPMVDTPQAGIAEALYQTALALTIEGAPQYALIYAQLSQFLRPGFAPGNLLLGDIFSALDQDGLALAYYQDVPDDSLAWWQAQLKAARVLQSMGRSADAVAALTDLAAARLDRGDAMIAIGDVMREEQRYPDAVRAYDEAFERAPDAVADDWSFFYRRGIALERAQVWDRAENDLQHALELNPDHAHLLNYLGYSWIDRGENVEEAERLIRRAVELLPDDGYIVDSLGWVYFRTGRLDDAVQWLERAVELLPDDAVINDHLGDAYWVVGRRAEARFQWRRALNAADTSDEPGLAERVEDKLQDGLHNPPFLDGVVIETNAANEANVPTTDTH
ncbi:MAG: tetratricopeptide repeat protein [Rhodospirillaceae bacterium]|nr:tetratricopeptide repeat protein [Rhodospirillaceae bacterium]